MADVETGESGKAEPPPLQIDPKCLQDALRSFFQPIKTDDPRLDFYNMYKREAMEYDTDYIKKYNEDLNTTLIFAGLFSAVSSAFVIDVHSQLRPDPNEQSAALLRAILLTLNQSAIPGETLAVPPTPKDPPSEVVTVTDLMYASLLISLLAAFVAMLGKQWLNRYLRNSGGSMIERCGDRQRKCDGLGKWPLHLFVESLPLMLQVALFLLASGLCRHMWSINASVAYTLIVLTGFGGLFYIAIVIAGTSSYACPFQTPVSFVLPILWKRLRRGTVSFIVNCRRAFSWTHHTWDRSIQPLPRPQSPPPIPLENMQVQQPRQWLKPSDRAAILRTNACDIRCVSWILRSITDPEALDAAVRLAGTVRWFEDGLGVEPPYDMIISTFHACFDINGKVYPGSRDRAYYSGRAILWIRTLAKCKSERLAHQFPLLVTSYKASPSDHDLTHFLRISGSPSAYYRFIRLAEINSGHTPSHLQWISNVQLHHSWANRTTLDFKKAWRYDIISGDETTLPLDVILNRLLVWCICLGSPVEEEALKVQDKSNHLKQILRQLSESIISAIDPIHERHVLVPYVLGALARWEIRSHHLTEMAYEWCSVMCENLRFFKDRESLLLLPLEIGFRHLDTDTRGRRTDFLLTHTEHHRGLVDVVFGSNDGEAIADLLHAWTAEQQYYFRTHALLDICTEHLVDLHHRVSFSPRLRRLVIHSVEVLNYNGFEEVGMGRFVGLLNHLHVTFKDTKNPLRWTMLLLDTLRSSEAIQHLSLYYWELLVELTILIPPSRNQLSYNPQITISLTEAQEWDKLECWIKTICIVWLSWDVRTMEEDLERAMLMLFRKRPGAFQGLKTWVERWGGGWYNDVPEIFKRIRNQASEAAQQDLPLTLSVDEAQGSAPSPSSGGSTFWASLPYHTL